MTGRRRRPPEGGEQPWRFALSVQAALLQSAWVGARLMIGYKAVELGATGFALGLVAASFAAPALLAALPVGRLSDRIGGARVALLGVAVFVSGPVLLCWANELWILVVAAAATGIGSLFVMIGQQTFTAHRGRDGTSDGTFAVLTTAASLGQLVGPPIVTLTASVGAVEASAPDTVLGAIACIVLVVLGLLGTPALLRADRQSAAAKRAEAESATDASGGAPKRRHRLVDLGRGNGLWRSVAVSAAVLVTVDLLYTFVPLWASEKGVSSVAVGALLAVRALVSVVSRVGLSRLVSRFGRKALLLVSIGCGVGALVALPFVAALGAIPVMVALGVALGIPQPLTMSWVVRITPKEVHGQALGLRMTANRFAQIVLPLGIGAVAGPLGVSVILWANAAVLAAALLIVTGSSVDDEEAPR
ncbi:hypothetical protein C5E10_14830 [Pseudoclavibacter sp. RFBG4]|uniref:MFS transporter n=1 Tax=Pseudoclavibacter sp. RFBG4 TaxID=2080575 RepID=UPI000CE79B40|nr:MFS transporter [Pseudoclavibacter sp. RFBG4]PPG27795.1 hypothetical protein C5E10_14830 [Pseudoclavibacter sp. RFBG4]